MDYEFYDENTFNITNLDTPGGVLDKLFYINDFLLKVLKDNGYTDHSGDVGGYQGKPTKFIFVYKKKYYILTSGYYDNKKKYSRDVLLMGEA